MIKIILVDDDRDDREFFATALTRISDEISCISLENGVALIPKLKSGEILRPNLIFLDVNVPEMSGWECLTLLKEYDDFKNIPVVMYSTSKYEEDILMAKSKGALCFFTKPFAISELGEALHEAFTHLKNGTIERLPDTSVHFS